MTTIPTKATFAASAPHQATFVVYINGIEVPAKSASLRYGVWQMPEMQVEMVADPVLVRLGSEDRVQVAVFYYDDCDVDKSVQPAFRLYGEGEITGWGYRNTSGGRSIVFTVVNQIAIFTQLFVQFMTSIDDMIAHFTHPGDVSGFANASSQLVYPDALFNQGLLPGQGSAPSLITRPYDFLYNAVKGMMASVVPDAQRTVAAANFFTRWARLTNFHNRFAASPFFDEVTDNPNIFPVLKAVQGTTAVATIIKQLIPQFQNAGSVWDMVQLVYTTMLMEVSMIPGMPLVTVDLASQLVQLTDFSTHTLQLNGTQWKATIADASRATAPLRMQNYFPKPQMLFSIPPSCNVLFPSQILNIAYEENYITQPTRLYFNDEVLTSALKIPKTGIGQAISNALSVAWPLEAGVVAQSRDTTHPTFNGKNILLYPEEFYKGPVMDRRTIPPWLFFLKQSDNTVASQTTVSDSSSSANQMPPPAQTGNPTPPAPSHVPPSCMNCTNARVGKVNANNGHTFDATVEALRKQSFFQAAIARYGLPEDFTLAWIQQESDGTNGPSATSTLNERGYFQIMGPHVDPHSGKAIGLAQTEAGQIGLSITDTGTNGRVNGVDQNPTARLTADAVFSMDAGCRLVKYYRNEANQVAQRQGLSWPDGDLWRLTKAGHVGMGFWTGTSTFPGFFQLARNALGHAPSSWSEMYNAISGSLSSQNLTFLNNATGVGGLAPGSSGSMLTAGNTQPFSASGAVPAPAAPSPSTSKTVAPTPPPTPQVSTSVAAAVSADTLDVYHLYAKFEYFRERYAKRSGSANLTWNPYIVPGYPGVLFDQRASRVDLLVYITTVQHMMSNEGRRSTSISFLYGRQFQEMFQLLSDEFALDDSVARGAAPEEPIRDISKVVQSFIQAETYYQRLFYGGQSLYGKAASFDFRNIIGMQSLVPGGSPDPIFVDGPDVVTQDANVTAAQNVATLTPLRDTASATLLDIQSRIASANAAIVALHPTSTQNEDATYATVQQSAYDDLQASVTSLTQAQAQTQATLTSLNQRIAAAIAVVQGMQTSTGTAFTRVEHNLDIAATRPLVPLPSTQQFFDSRDAALRYNWRPICTLDEYVVFFDSAAEGSIPAFGHARSVGARFFERIRTMTPPAAGFQPPVGADGLGTGTTVPGLSSANFPQTTANWDVPLLAYRNNVLYNKAPRT